MEREGGSKKKKQGVFLSDETTMNRLFLIFFFRVDDENAFPRDLGNTSGFVGVRFAHIHTLLYSHPTFVRISEKVFSLTIRAVYVINSI